ncbi:MAG TPA: NADPH-dependent FMN reductase [Candidatus Solibacter sp.]|jgi:azobenzene reductase|nr:NADPH-dependent FMN reductase [Candidatus Solibacter sp.]
MKVLLLGGSLHRPSHTSAMLRIIDAELSRAGHEPIRWDLGERPLPSPDPQYHRDPLLNPDPEAHRLTLAADAAQAFVLASPNYHNSFSGLLKDALDNLSVAQFEGKATGLASNGGGIPATQAVDQLRIVARGLGAIAIPTQFVTTDTDWVEGQDGYELASDSLQRRLQRFVAELISVGSRLGGGER